MRDDEDEMRFLPCLFRFSRESGVYIFVNKIQGLPITPISISHFFFFFPPSSIYPSTHPSRSLSLPLAPAVGRTEIHPALATQKESKTSRSEKLEEEGERGAEKWKGAE